MLPRTDLMKFLIEMFHADLSGEALMSFFWCAGSKEELKTALKGKRETGKHRERVTHKRKLEDFVKK